MTDVRAELPVHQCHELSPKRSRYCVVVTVWNEGERIRQQLLRMRSMATAYDIVLADGDSTDGALAIDFLREQQVRALLVTAERGLCTALRMGFHFAIQQGYAGVITVDGNGKDGIEAVSEFAAALDGGFDFVQGSRFIAGGHHVNTPLERYLGVRFVMSPIISLASGYHFTDVTNGFKACSMRFLCDPRVQPLRGVFKNFNLQLYLNYRAARLGFRVTEIPVSRVYPDDGSVPTKITTLRRKLLNVGEMLLTAVGHYNP
jgi:glycosyltransferase involved in cell wall biosynthesis